MARWLRVAATVLCTAATIAAAQFDAPGSYRTDLAFPFDASKEAYKLGVNYMIYGLTH